METIIGSLFIASLTVLIVWHFVDWRVEQILKQQRLDKLQRSKDSLLAYHAATRTDT